MRRIIPLAAAAMLLAGAAWAQDQPPPVPPDVAAPAAPPGNPEMTGPKILIQTSMGDIMVQLDAVHAPASVANILSYVKDGHYNGTVFYRVEKGFVIQMGSWDARGRGRSMHPGAVAFEGGNGLKNLRGTLALGRGDDLQSAGPDFFINLVDDAALDPNPAANQAGYAVFGQVIQGMDVVDAIAAVPVGQGLGPMPAAAPNDPVIVKKVSRLPR